MTCSSWVCRSTQCHLSLGADDVCKGSKDLLAALCQIAEIVIVGLHELPDHRHCEHNNQSNGGPNRNGVIAHSCCFSGSDLNGKASEQVILLGSAIKSLDVQPLMAGRSGHSLQPEDHALTTLQLQQSLEELCAVVVVFSFHRRSL